MKFWIQKWDETCILRGGITLVLETKLGKHGAHERGQGRAHNRSQSWSSVSTWDWKEGGVAAVLRGAWLQAGIDWLSKYVKENGSQVSHHQRRDYEKGENKNEPY